MKDMLAFSREKWDKEIKRRNTDQETKMILTDITRHKVTFNGDAYTVAAGSNCESFDDMGKRVTLPAYRVYEGRERVGGFVDCGNGSTTWEPESARLACTLVVTCLLQGHDEAMRVRDVNCG